MIVLDTDVISEPLRAQPSATVLEWLDRQAAATLYLTTISLAELWAGIQALARGRRRSQLQRAVTDQVAALFEGRVLAFDAQAAERFGALSALASAAGNRIDFADCAIAAIAASHGHSIATRNVRDFRGTGLQLIDPWSVAAA